MKLNKYLSIKLEQLYNSSLTEPEGGSGWADEREDDVPYGPQQHDRPYKTFVGFPPFSEEIEEPEIKTKKGKNILREPPGDPDAEPEDVDIDLYDDEGNEIEESLVFEQTPEEDENNMGALAQANMNEPNTETGVDPNTADPTQQPNDQAAMMGGAQQGTATAYDPTGGMGMAGGMGYEQPKTADEIGKTYELKKIYSRLLSIDSQLSFSSDVILLKLRKFISKAIELFEILIANESSFKDEIDDIIIKYYEFLSQVYSIIKRFYEIKQKEDNKLK